MVEGCFCPLDRAPQSPGHSGSFLGIFLIPAPITLDGGLANYCIGLCCVGDPSPGRQVARKGPGLASLLPRVGRAPVQSSPCHMAGWHQWVQTSPPTWVFSSQADHWPALSWPHPEGSDQRTVWPLPATRLQDAGSWQVARGFTSTRTTAGVLTKLAPGEGG